MDGEQSMGGKRNVRIGLGFDVHPFAAGRRLVLGGVEIPFPQGLEGHSDADVILHAVMDAVLGALALGDIGQHFPNTDPKYSGVDSKVLSRHVWDMVCERGYSIGNMDVMVMAEQPKLLLYVSSIRDTIAKLFDCSKEQVSVKATTMEAMGFVGRKEGIAAQAVVLLVRQEKER